MAFGGLDGADEAPMADINMVPMIDIMLVLLIIFIVTAPLMQHGVQVNLPQSSAAALPPPTPFSVELVVDAEGQWSVDGEGLSDAELGDRLKAIAMTHPDAEVRIRADQSVPYARVARLMAAASGAGLARLAFVAAPDKGE